jgi:hypothetical protein
VGVPESWVVNLVETSRGRLSGAARGKLTPPVVPEENERATPGAWPELTFEVSAFLPLEPTS